MYYAWKDDNFLLKILTSIILFIFLSMVIISPVFSFSYDTPSGETFEFSDIPVIEGYNYYYINLSQTEYYNYLTLSKDIPEFQYDESIKSYNLYYTGDFKHYLYNFENSTWEIQKKPPSLLVALNPSNAFYFSNFEISFDDGTVVNPKPVISKPNFMNTKEELSSGKFEILKIDAGDMDYDSDSFILNIYDNYSIGDGVYNDYIQKSILLDKDSQYRVVSDLNIYYYIPQSNLGIDLTNGKRYTFDITSRGEDKEVYDSVTFEVGGLTSEEEQQNKDDEQTDAIKENTETNKRYMGNNKRYTRLYKPI